MDSFRFINTRAYVCDLLKGKPDLVFYAYKAAVVKARIGQLGEEILTIGSNGVKETKNVVRKDDDGRLDWVVSKPDGNNAWIVTAKNFAKTYEPVDEKEGLYRPIKMVRKFIRLDESVCFDGPWGERMSITEGGFLNITDLNAIYGIQKEDFDLDYKIITPDGE